VRRALFESVGSTARRVAGVGVVVLVIATTASASTRSEELGRTSKTLAVVTEVRSRTIATTPYRRVRAVVAQGRRLAWLAFTSGGANCEQVFQVFDRRTRRLSTIRPGYNCEVPEVIGPALAGTRLLYGDGSFGLSTNYADVYTLAIGERRPRHVGSFAISRSGGPGDVFKYPALVAGGGGTLLFYGFETWSPGPLWRGIWRVNGKNHVRVPYDPELLVDVAVDRRHLATANWVGGCPCESDPAWAPDGQTIAWAHDPGQIWLMRPDGREQRKLTDGLMPRWSPNGASLVFWRDGSIYVIGRDGTGERQVTAGNFATWSPDGQRLAFVRGNDVWTVNGDGSAEKRLTNDGLASDRPEWSPDGKQLAIGRAGSLYLIDAASGAERELTSGESPRWSPDGSSIVFVYNADVGRIGVIRADGSGLRTLVDDLYTNDPAWSPDGKHIAYEQAGSDVIQAHVVNADGSNDRTVRAEHGCAPAWSPDGKTIATGRDEDGCGAGIWTIGASGSGNRLLAAPTKPPAVEVRDDVTGTLIRRWLVPGVSKIWLSGRYVLAAAESKKGCRIVRFDVATGSRLGTESCGGWAELTLSARSGAFRIGRKIFSLDAKTGRTKQLALAATEPGGGPVIDGNRVFWTEPFRKGSRVREVVLP
jgi:WD40 repeat protein